MWSANEFRRYTLIAIVAALVTLGTQASAEIISGLVGRALPTAIVDGTHSKARLGRYGELFAIQLFRGSGAVADEGTYFHAMTATPGTAYNLSGATQATWVATTPTFTVKNNDAEAAKRLYLDFVRISALTVNTGGTNFAFQVVIDNVTRYSSGGTALTAYNVNMDSATASLSTQQFGGAITALAATNPRYTCRGNLKNAILAVGDTFTIDFASNADSSSAKLCPAAVLGGGDSVLVYTWATGQTATATGEVDAGWWER